MRVLMLSLRFHPLGDGTERQALALSRTLVARGIEVAVATARFRGLAASEMVDGVTVDRLPYVPDRRRFRRLANYTYLAALGAYLHRRAPTFDVLHCHMATFPVIPTIVAGRRHGRPVVVKIACAGTEGDIQRLRSIRSDPAGELGRVTLTLLHQASAIVAPSRVIERELADQGFQRVYYVPNGVDTDRFRPAGRRQRAEARQRLSLPADAFIMGFMGRLEKQKALEVLLDAWLRSTHWRRGGVLCIAGTGREEANLRRQLAAGGDAAGSVRFLGRVDPGLFLHALDVFVLPSRFEGMPNALLEATASGLPCVGTRIGGTEDILQDGQCGFLVPADDVSALTCALDRLSSAEVRQRLGEAARARSATEFSLNGVAKKYTDLYEHLLSRARSASGPVHGGQHRVAPTQEEKPSIHHL